VTTVCNLTDEQLRELEVELRSARARLERLMAVRAGGTDPGEPAAALRARIEDGGARAIDELTLARHQQLIEALSRMEAGEYGTCERCRNPIPFGRLDAVPEATRCITCAAYR
jgi:DnaK suppressor protein